MPRYVMLGLVAAMLVGCTRPSGPSNVLLVSIDSLGAHRLGCYGNARATSPVLDRLAAEGVRFAHATSPTSWTLPTHVSLLTGRSQQRHQTVRYFDRIRDSERLLSEAFAGAGFETVGIYSGPFLSPTYGFDRGFDRYTSCESEATATLQGQAAWTSSHSDRTNAKVEETFDAWMRTRSARPFFAFIHMWDVHFDYIPPDPYASMFDTGYAGPLDGRDIAGAGFPLTASPADVAHLMALYDGEIRYTDDTIGRLLAALEKAGALADTLVVITADHGDEFLEHGGKGHQRTLFEEVIHVPLIVWSKAGLSGGRVVEQPVSLIDVAPTILEIMKLPALPAADGRSLAALLRGGALEDRPVYSELYASRTGKLKAASIRQASTKVVYDAPSEASSRQAPSGWRTYDLAADPRETRPAEAAADAVPRVLLQSYVTAAEAAIAEHAASAAINERVLPDDLLQKLRTLGYVE
jgi:arylsulfatase A-like enzyme